MPNDVVISQIPKSSNHEENHVEFSNQNQVILLEESVEQQETSEEMKLRNWVLSIIYFTAIDLQK